MELSHSQIDYDEADISLCYTHYNDGNTAGIASISAATAYVAQ